MITQYAEYYSKLYRIQNDTKPDRTLRVPEGEPVYEIDLASRTIKAPVYLSTATDHLAETVFFHCKRRFDNVDLADMCCIIQFVNAEGVSAIYPVPYYDITTDENGIYFPWMISGVATAAPGTVKFSVRFFKLDEQKRIVYSLLTKQASSVVHYGMEVSNDIVEAFDKTSKVWDTYYLVEEEDKETQTAYNLAANFVDQTEYLLHQYFEKFDIKWTPLEGTIPENPENQ